jgi:transcriptional regulator with XRE-family HTH domain
MSEFLILVGSRLKSIRKEKGLTQDELAEKANLHYSYIGGIERGERNISLISFNKILEALEISPMGFFSYNKINIIDKEQNKNRLIIKHNDLLNSLSNDEIIILNQLIQNMIKFKETQKL